MGKSKSKFQYNGIIQLYFRIWTIRHHRARERIHRCGPASSELGCTITDDCQVHLGLWLPDVPNGTKIPVIADVGPYYDDGDVDALTPANRLGLLIENMVPHGYAVAQVLVLACLTIAWISWG